MKGMIVAIMLAVAAVALACEPPAPQAAPVTSSAFAEVGLPAKPGTDGMTENTPEDPMVWTAERVPGFGGIFLDSSQDIVYIYLQDVSMREVAKAVLTDAFGSDLLEGREVRVLEGKYRMVHLEAWYQTLMGAEHRVPGIAWTDVNTHTNRIEIGMYPRRDARAKMEAVMAAAGVPQQAVVINVGCEGGYPRYSRVREKSADEAFLSAIDFSLEAASHVPHGETVRMKLTLRNVSDERLQFFAGRRPRPDFVVATDDGVEIWNQKCGQIGLQPLLARKNLEPGEELAFVGEWEQVDYRGEPVPAGTYLVTGVLNLRLPERLATAPHQLRVLR